MQIPVVIPDRHITAKTTQNQRMSASTKAIEPVPNK